MVTINYNAILETAVRGARRAYVFMGLGLNAASNPELKEYTLEGFGSIQIVPSNVDEHKIARFKENFAAWVINNGLRELIESFAVFLDQIYDASLRVAVSKKGFEPEEAKKRYSAFTMMGIDKKLKRLNEGFEITTNNSEHLNSIYLARNSLSHCLGLVGDFQCNYGSTLILKWIGLDYVAATEGGRAELITGPFDSLKDMTIGIRWTERSLTFCLGSPVCLTPNALNEICFFIWREANSITASARNFAISNGIPLSESNPPPSSV